MEREEFELMISMALILRSMAAPDNRRELDRRIEALEDGRARWAQAAIANTELEKAARLALNYIENTESEFGIKLDSGDALRIALNGVTS